MEDKRIMLGISALAVAVAMVMSLGATAATSSSSDNWRVDLNASSFGISDTVTVGMADSPENAPKMPPNQYFPPELDWAIVSAGETWGEFIVEHQNSYEWSLTMAVDSENDVTFTWDNVASLPDNKDLLVEIKGENVNVEENDSYTAHFTQGSYTIPVYAETVAVNVAPTADFSYSPESPTTQATVEFTDNSTDPDGTIASWSWDFDGDGVTDSTSENPSHSYDSAGDYTAELTVTDDDGATDSYSTTVTVSPAGEWSLELNATGNGMTDNIWIGMAGTPENMKVTEPFLNFVNWEIEAAGEDWDKWIVEIQDNYTWGTTVEASPENEVLFTWENLEAAGVPDNTPVELQFGSETIDMREQTSYGPVTLSYRDDVQIVAGAVVEEDTTPPTISNVDVTTTATTATITWTTDEQATTEVEYDGETSVDETPTTSHSVTLSGLDPGTTYTYQVLSTDEAGNEASSSEDTFTTEEVAVEDVVDYYNGADDQLSVSEVVDAVDDFIEGVVLPDPINRQLMRSDIETLVDQLYEDLTG